MRASVFVLLCACGRVGFDPTGGGDLGADARSDGTPGGDGEVCSTARRLAFGVALIDESLAGATNDYPNSCGDGPDIVYAVEQLIDSNRSFSVSSTFRGAMWISASCPPSVGSCGNFDVGTPISTTMRLLPGMHYVFVDKVSGAGTTFTINVD